MDISFPELAHLTLTAIVTLTVLLGLIDTAWAVLQALAQHKFDGSFADAFLVTHAPKWFAIIALAVLGAGTPALDVPALGVCTLAAEAGLALYAVAIVTSLMANTRDATAPGLVSLTGTVEPVHIHNPNPTDPSV